MMFKEQLVAEKILLRRRMLEKQLAASAHGSTVAQPLAPYRPRRKKQRSFSTWNAPRKDVGLRKPARSSDKNERGFTIFNGHQVNHESGLEHRVSVIFQADRTVADIFAQRSKVDYRDAKGKLCHTIFDFLVILKDGTWIGVAVKPERYRERIMKMFDQIKATSKQTDLDRLVFVSDEQATMDKFANARDILWAREHVDDDEARYVVRTFGARDTLGFWELYESGNIGNWSRKAAIWRLIDVGILEPVCENERICDVSYLKIVR